MSFLSKLKNQRGFTLVEVAIVTAITTLALGTGLWTKIQEAHVKKGEVLGEQLHRISAGVDDYLNKNYSALVQFTPNVSGFADPLHPTITELKAKNYLPGGISNSNIYGGGYKVFITKTPSGCVPSTCNLSVLTMISSPVLQQSSGALDTVALGSASKAIGGDAAVSHTAATLDGTGGTWSESNPLGQAGIVAVRSGYGVSSMNEFYRRNGSMPLTGDLSGGGQNINNVNQVNSQSINNADDVATNTVTATGDVTGAKFIDKNDPGYYVDPNGTSRTGRINADYLYSYGDIQGNRFVDKNNPGYYVDPNGMSNINHIEFNDALVDTIAIEGGSCSPNGMIARTNIGLLLSCQSGKWAQASGGGGGSGGIIKGVDAYKNTHVNNDYYQDGVPGTGFSWHYTQFWLSNVYIDSSAKVHGHFRRRSVTHTWQGTTVLNINSDGVCQLSAATKSCVLKALTPVCGWGFHLVGGIIRWSNGCSYENLFAVLATPNGLLWSTSSSLSTINVTGRFLAWQ